MVNKLRVYAGTLGGAAAITALWAAVEYGSRPGALPTLAAAAAVGLAVAVAPLALALAKQALERRRHAGLDQELYASSPIEVDRASFLDATREAVESEGSFVGVTERAFPEGAGLIVEHTRFHGTFVRLTDAGRIVVTGVKSRATRAVADELEALWSTTLSRTASNPFVGPIPVRGAPRVLLSLLLTAAVVADVALVAGVAYPAPAYNPGERTALMAYDARAGVDPGVSETDAALDKAGFLISVLREEATEIRWGAGLAGNGTVPDHDAEAISADVSRLLDTARASGPDAAQGERIDRLEAEHADARESVRAAIEAVRNGSVGSGDGPSQTATAAG